MQSFNIRQATVEDAPRLLEIYTPYVINTPITFEYDVPSVEEFAGRIAHYTEVFPWLVCEVDGEIAGYAYASRYRESAAYQWCCEYSVYLDPRFHRRGIGRALYTALTSLLILQGYTMAYAGVTIPNAASITLHESIGFKSNGVFHHAGYKLGCWHDVEFLEMPLAAFSDRPQQPLKIGSLLGTAQYDGILSNAMGQIKG